MLDKGVAVEGCPFDCNAQSNDLSRDNLYDVPDDFVLSSAASVLSSPAELYRVCKKCCYLLNRRAYYDVDVNEVDGISDHHVTALYHCPNGSISSSLYSISNAISHTQSAADADGC